ncbi:MAG: hypothetical protein LCH53_10045 [Bacteroidetes bacterium]|nr:hypothetical protein [Bacteroidota bacterium]
MLAHELVAGVFIPTVIALVVWAGMMAKRIVSEDPASPVEVHERAARMREIRQTVRHQEYRLREASYRFDRTRGSHMPRLWMVDVAHRLN